MLAVDIQNLSHTYPAHRRNESPRAVLNKINLSVVPGQIFGLLGPNGGGKTTLFRVLSTALEPQEGRALVCGVDVKEYPSMVRRRIGVVFQNPSLDGQLTVRENLLHQGHLYGMRGERLDRAIDEALTRFSLMDRKEDGVKNLSGGLKRRVEIAKGLLHKPDLLLMDEPSTGLDPGARRDMWRYVFDLKKQGTAILFTTHLMDEGERCDQVAILNRGHCVAQGSPEQLKNKIGGDVVIIHSRDIDSLSENIKIRFGISSVRLEDTLRIEVKEGHKFIPQVVEAFPGAVASIAVGKPTLEDVFVHETGQSWDNPPRS